MSFFQKLYEGEYAPMGEEMPKTAEFKACWQCMSDAEEALQKLLTKEQLKVFAKYQQAQLEVEKMLQVHTFEKGFYIGAEFQRDYKRIDHLPEQA